MDQSIWYYGPIKLVLWTYQWLMIKWLRLNSTWYGMITYLQLNLYMSHVDIISCGNTYHLCTCVMLLLLRCSRTRWAYLYSNANYLHAPSQGELSKFVENKWLLFLGLYCKSWYCHLTPKRGRLKEHLLYFVCQTTIPMIYLKCAMIQASGINVYQH